MEKNFRIMVIHEKTGEIRQIKAGKSITNALRQVKDVALKLELNCGDFCVYEVSVRGDGEAPVRFDNLKVVRAWLAENVAPDAITF